MVEQVPLRLGGHDTKQQLQLEQAGLSACLFSIADMPLLFLMTQRGHLNCGALLTLNAAGNTLPLSAIPVGMAVHNVELRPGAGGQLARSAGASCTLVKKGGPERGGARCCVQQALATDPPPAAVLPHNSGLVCKPKLAGMCFVKRLGVLRSRIASFAGGLPQPVTCSPFGSPTCFRSLSGDDGYSVLKLPSGEQRLVLSRCMAAIGVLSNPQASLVVRVCCSMPCASQVETIFSFLKLARKPR